MPITGMVMSPAMISRVPAAESQLSLNVGMVDGFPLAVCSCSPGHCSTLVGASSRSLTTGIWVMLKITMMMRYGAYALSTSRGSSCRPTSRAPRSSAEPVPVPTGWSEPEDRVAPPAAATDRAPPSRPRSAGASSGSST